MVLFFVEAKLLLQCAFFLRNLKLFLFVRFALKQKNQKFKTWKLRLKITYTL
jgi:hypothetical protein